MDHDICIYAINRKRPEVLSRVRGYSLGEVGISAVTYHELRFGVENSAKIDANIGRLERFLPALETVPLNRVADLFGRGLKAVLATLQLLYLRKSRAKSVCYELRPGGTRDWSERAE